MKINCKRYLKTLDACRPLLIKYKDSPTNAINNVSISSMVPIIAVCEWAMLKRNLGPLPELAKSRQTFIDFYHYTEIESITEEEDSPSE